MPNYQIVVLFVVFKFSWITLPKAMTIVSKGAKIRNRYN